MIHQIEIKNEWFPSAVFTAKFGLVFVLILEKVFSQTFHFKANRKSTGSSKNGTRDFLNNPQFERSVYFYLTITGDVERFQYFIFEEDFLENENLYSKTEVNLFS